MLDGLSKIGSQDEDFSVVSRFNYQYSNMQPELLMFQSTLHHRQHHPLPSQRPSHAFCDYVLDVLQPKQTQERNQCVSANRDEQ
jgi:hypothetical protein